MDKIDKMVEQFVKPIRCNYMNILYEEHEVLPLFERLNVRLVTFDKKELCCILFKLKTESEFPSQTIIYNHSHGSCKYEGVHLLSHCVDAKFNLLVYDSRACGESGDDAIYFGAKEKIDLLFITLYLALVHKTKKLLLWGRSIGCNAVLQFYQTLISKDGDFMNRVIKIQANKSNLEKSRDSKILYSVSRTNLELYPPMFNKFINQHFQTFLENNKIDEDIDSQFSLLIGGLILDSPYESFTSFIEDNMKKIVNFMPGMMSSLANMYLKSWMNSRLNLDIENDQNIELITKINLNTVFIVSDKDEIVSHERYAKLINAYAQRFPHKNTCFKVNTGKNHGSRRAKDLIQEVFRLITSNQNPSNIYSFTYRHQIADASHSTFIKASMARTNQITSLHSRPNVIGGVNSVISKSVMTNEQFVKKGLSIYRMNSQTPEGTPTNTQSQTPLVKNGDDFDDIDEKRNSVKFINKSSTPILPKMEQSNSLTQTMYARIESQTQLTQFESDVQNNRLSQTMVVTEKANFDTEIKPESFEKSYDVPIEPEEQSFATKVAESLLDPIDDIFNVPDHPKEKETELIEPSSMKQFEDIGDEILTDEQLQPNSN